MDKEFNIVKAEQQATTLNEDIDNYGSVTNAFSDETEEEVDLTLLFGQLLNNNQEINKNITNDIEQRQGGKSKRNNTYNSRYSNEATRNAFNIARGLFQDL